MNTTELEGRTQIIYLQSPKTLLNARLKKNKEENKNNFNNQNNIPLLFNNTVMEFSYFSIPNKKYINLGKGTSKLFESDGKYGELCLIFYDQSKNLKFQGWPSKKYTSISRGMNEKILIINKILGIVFILDEKTNGTIQKEIMTNIKIKFVDTPDISFFEELIKTYI